VERDYVFGWLIGGAYSVTPLADVVTLKGGNALRKAYLPASRYSDDLDFSCPTGLNAEGVLAAFNDACRYTQADRSQGRNPRFLDKDCGTCVEQDRLR
jgi:predicted nucleotidyltransferase component of viral defense system